MNKETQAVEIFLSGKNCAQSVLMSFATDLNIDKTNAAHLTSGFGAGMGRLLKTCGAVTGSFMVIGRHNCLNVNDETDRGEKTNALIQKLENDFSKEFGTTDCGPIINVDLKTEEGRKSFGENNLKEKVCSKCVAFCARWLDKNLGT